MYATPTLRSVPAAGESTCCTITMGEKTIRDDPECSARGFPTCNLNLPGILVGPDICTVSVGPLTISG